MAEAKTLARPYAQAIFEFALNNEALDRWSQILNDLAMFMENDGLKAFLKNPLAKIDDQLALLFTPFEEYALKEKENIHNFLQLLAQNKRLQLLPEIAVLFELQRQEHQKKIKVQIQSFAPLSQAQQERLVFALSRRLHREVSLQVQVNKDLLGGAIIQAGDLTIDGSVRGKLMQLAAELAA